IAQGRREAAGGMGRRQGEIDSEWRNKKTQNSLQELRVGRDVPRCIKMDWVMQYNANRTANRINSGTRSVIGG
ncbi:MAG: hypothetical protein ACNA8K_12680, partial [Cyclonatronaceae bacterium]